MKELSIQYPCLVDELTTTVTVVHGNYPQCKMAKRCKAIWDTGANLTVVSIRVIGMLGLDRVEELKPRPVKTANGIVMSYAYRACLEIDSQWPPLKMIIWSMPHSDIEVLIGMDIISRGMFRLWPQDGRTMLTFAL